MVYVTHDQEEAMTLGDRIAVMSAGELQQLAAPIEVYRRPANLFVAAFIGSPEMNLINADVSVDDGVVHVTCDAFSLRLEEGPGGESIVGNVIVGIRPHEVAIVPHAEADAHGVVQLVEQLGSVLLVHVRTEGTDRPVRVIVDPDASVHAGQKVGLRLSRAALHLFRGEDGRRID